MVAGEGEERGRASDPPEASAPAPTVRGADPARVAVDAARVGADAPPAPLPAHRVASRALVAGLLGGPLVSAFSLVVSAVHRATQPAWSTPRYQAGETALLFLVGGGALVAGVVLAEALARRASRAWRVPLLVLLGLAACGLVLASVAWVRALLDGGTEAAWTALREGAEWIARRPAQAWNTASLPLVTFTLVGASRVDLWTPRTRRRAVLLHLGAGAAAGLSVFLMLAAMGLAMNLVAFLGYLGSSTVLALGPVLADALEPRLAAWLRRRTDEGA